MEGLGLGLGLGQPADHLGTSRHANVLPAANQRSPDLCLPCYLFFNLPLGATTVTGGTGRVDVEAESLGAPVSFLGFFTILLLRCSPLGIVCSSLG